MQFEIEIIDNDNEDFLCEMIYDAIYVPENEKPLPLSVIEEPSISKYIDKWGRKGDFGIIATISGIKVGAIWIRFFNLDNKSFGFINDTIPELSMAIKPKYRNQGLGSEMMKRFLTMAYERGIPCISISVDKRNKALNFYKRIGFNVVSENKDDFIMKIEI